MWWSTGLTGYYTDSTGPTTCLTATGLSASLTFSKAPFATCTPAIALTPGHLTLTCALANPPPGVLSLAAGDS